MIEVNEIFTSIGDNGIFKSIFSSALLMAIIISVVIILLMVLMLDVCGSTGKFILIGIMSTAIIGSGMAIHNSMNRYISEKETTDAEQLEDVAELINPSIINRTSAFVGAADDDDDSSAKGIAEDSTTVDVPPDKSGTGSWEFMIGGNDPASDYLALSPITTGYN